jgi:hypothetical protein
VLRIEVVKTSTVTLDGVVLSFVIMKISLGGEQSVSSDEAENVSDNSGMQHDVWTNSGAE